MNGICRILARQVVLDDAIRSYTNYRITVQACHEFLPTPLCSEPSEPVSVLTKIGGKRVTCFDGEPPPVEHP